MIRRSIFLVLLTLSSEGHSAEWAHAASSSDGIVFVDISSISAERHREVWEKYEYIPPKSGVYTNLKFVKHDCSGRRSSISSYVNYGKDGVVLKSSSFSEDYWQPVVPDTIGESIFNVVCEWGSDPVNSPEDARAALEITENTRQFAMEIIKPLPEKPQSKK